MAETSDRTRRPPRTRRWIAALAALLAVTSFAAGQDAQDLSPRQIRTGTLSYTGQRQDLSAREIKTPPLRYTGQRQDLSSREIRTPTLRYIGESRDLSPREVRTPTLRYTGAPSRGPALPQRGRGLQPAPSPERRGPAPHVPMERSLRPPAESETPATGGAGPTRRGLGPKIDPPR